MSATPLRAAVSGYDVERVRRDFPILSPDGARQTAGLPRQCRLRAAPARRHSRAVEDYETHSHANVHRGVHALSQEATAAFEGARERVRRFINARSTREIIFTRGTTEAINLVAQSWAVHGWDPAMRSSSRRWSTTPISCPGKCARRHGLLPGRGTH